MADFTLDDGQQNVRALLNWVMRSEVRPRSLQADRDKRFPDELLVKLGQLGLSGEAAPERYGGDGDGVGGEQDSAGVSQKNRLAIIGAEEVAWGDPAMILTIPGPGLGGPPVRFMGTEAQRKRFFAPFEDTSVPRYGAYGLTEPGAGSDVAAIRTSAVKDGSHWVLNGTKCYISNGAKAEWVVIFATVDPGLGRAGHRAFVVEKGTPGFRVGRLEEKMGLRATETAELVLEDCRVPAENLLGGEARYASSEGFKVAMKTFDTSRPMVAAMAVGIARAALEFTRDFVKDALGRSGPGSRYERCRQRLGELSRRVDAARLMCWKAAWMADAGLPNAKEASMSKAYAGRLATEICIEAIELLGANGVHKGHLLEKWFRDIKVFDIFEGTGQVQRIVIAKRLIEGLRAF